VAKPATTWPQPSTRPRPYQQGGLGNGNKRVIRPAPRMMAPGQWRELSYAWLQISIHLSRWSNSWVTDKVFQSLKPVSLS
jgi:hypothetical protein